MDINEKLSFTIKNTKNNIYFLLKNGYQKRSGSISYNRNYIKVLPLKKMFWESSDNSIVENYI